MDVPESLYGALATEGEIYFFEKECPVGIENHPHILIKHKDVYLFLTTCSSRLDTAIRLAHIRKWDSRTYPVLLKSDSNKLQKDSYVNCNAFVELTEERFGSLIAQGLIHRDKGNGVVNAEELNKIYEGISLSINISDEDKERILG